MILKILSGRLINLGKTVFPAILFFLFFFTLLFVPYVNNGLNGHPDNFILSSKIFGLPKQILDKGLEPVLEGKDQYGWDGQFYYFISNDVLGSKDTAAHLDSPSYRYQRVGFPLFAKIVSLILLKSWVSPLLYLVTSILIVCFALGYGALFFKNRGRQPLLILLWGTSVGVFLTLFSGLPDAVADSFLIIGLLSFIEKRYFLSTFSLVFAALSREIYVVFPLVLFGYELIKTLRFSGIKTIFLSFLECIKKNWYLLLPVVIFCCWYCYVTIKFGATPSSQAFGILGLPFKATLDNIIQSFPVSQPWTTLRFWKYLFLGNNLGCIMAFIGILMFSFVSFIVKIKNERKNPSELSAISLAGIGLTLMYFCFGNTVMMEYTGYLKAISVFLFLTPLILDKGKFKIVCLSFLIIFSIYTLNYFNNTRIKGELGLDEKYRNFQNISKQEFTENYKKFEVNFQIKSLKSISDEFLFNLGSNYNKYLLTIELTNNTDTSLFTKSTIGENHPVFLSYQIKNKNQEVIGLGIRSAIVKPIDPGATGEVSMLIKLPKTFSDYDLSISLVQEGVCWFSQMDSRSQFRIHIN